MYTKFDQYLGAIAKGLAKDVFPHREPGSTVYVRTANFVFTFVVPER